MEDECRDEIEQSRESTTLDLENLLFPRGFI
jgi:hypothetical protein